MQDPIASKGVIAMIASQLLLVAAFFDRLNPRPHHRDVVDRSESPLYRAPSAILRALRAPSPLVLNDHLRRDIGLEPQPNRRDLFWPW